MSDGKICKHSKIDVYEDEDGRGYFAECEICEGVGPLRKSATKAREALKALRIERPSNQGGVREGAGRKKRLPSDAKLCSHTLFPKHFKKIERYIRKHNEGKDAEDHIKGRSAALRSIIDELKV